MATGTFSGTLTVGSIQMQTNISRTAVGTEGHEPVLAAGLAATLTTRTSDFVGVLTMEDGHGLVTGDVIAVSWTDVDGVPCVIYGFEATVTVNAVALALHASEMSGVLPAATVLPADETDVIVSKRVQSNVSVTYTDLTMIGVNCNQPAVGVFGSGTTTVVYAVQIPVAYSPAFWDSAAGATCPIGANITKCDCYNRSLVAATFQYGFLLDT